MSTTGEPAKIRSAAPASLPSLLAGWMRGILRAVIWLSGFLVADALYLSLVRLADWAEISPFALGGESLPLLYQVMLLGHTGIGLVLAVIVAVFFTLHLPRVWRRLSARTGWSGAAALALAAITTVTGLFIVTAAASRANAWAWWMHVLGGAGVVVAYLGHRFSGSVLLRRRMVGHFFAWSTAGSMTLFMAHGLMMATADRAETTHANNGSPMAVASARAPERPAGEAALVGHRGWVPTGEVDPERRFFPAPTGTTSQGLLDESFFTAPAWGPPASAVRDEVELTGFAAESRIGVGECASCHADIAEQWASSAHRFSSFNNPFYEASILGLLSASGASNPWIDQHLRAFPDGVSGVGEAKSKWCAGCHDPALLLSGGMGLGVDRSSPAAQAGLTCLACHAIDSIHDRSGNGNYRIADLRKSPYLFSGSGPGSALRFLHDASLRARPEPHRRAMRRPFFGESEFCATCHKVSLTQPVNDYRWLRGQNEFDAWDDSGVALNAARTFYLPPTRRTCQDCHMALEPAPLGDLAADRDGMVRSHRFLAANTALPYLRGDSATIHRTETFMRAGRLRVDIFAARVDDSDDDLFPLDRSGVGAVPTAVPITFDVVVRNLDVGHSFPGGTNDSNEAWLEFRIGGEDGGELAMSGAMGVDGRVDPMAHFFRAVLVDSGGSRITERNPQDIRATAYSNLIGPGTSDLAHYRLTLPEWLEGTDITVRARLLWRKFDRDFTEFAFERNPRGFAGLDGVPHLPVTVIASDSLLVRVAGGEASAGAPGDSPLPFRADPTAPDWMRWNDYGIALLLEGDTRRASLAFEHLERIEPDRVDGPLNLARALVAAGNLPSAYEALTRAEAILPGDARVAWVWSRALAEDGDYVRAESALRRVLDVFPRDRAAWRELGRSLYLDGRYSDALEAFAAVLDIDPEDRVAHYHRMLSLRALGREDEARVAEAAYLHYGIDESAQQLTLAFRARDPGANLMAQDIPVHRLSVGGGPPGAGGG